MKINKIKFMITIFIFLVICLLGMHISNASYTSYDIKGIDTSKYSGYKELLQKIQSQYPNWKIKLLYTGLDWNYVIEQERQGHGSSPKSLIYDTYDEAWRCQEPSCKGVKYDVSKRWYCASRQAVEYMMDPRNSLDAAYIFQFQDLSSSVGDREAVKKMTENTFLYNDSYIDAIIEAAQTEGISPFHIVSRIKQEQGATGAGAMNGYLYRTKTGEFVKVYNLFNINVSGNDTEAGLLAGAQYAYDQQWFSVEASIKGGAKFIKKQYINQGQATLYFQKYNVVDSSNLFNHQYMQNIRAANDEGNTMYRAYLKNGILSSTFEFTIPVYENMPVLAVPRPQYIPVQKITTEQETYIIGVNEVIDINYGYLPRNASNTDFSWTASNSSVLSVYWNRVRGLKEGTSQIIVKTQDGSIEKQITIIVQPKVQEIIPEQEEYTIGVNEVIDINYSYLPTNAANIDFSWTVSDTSILSVYWNKVRGLKEGTAYVIVKTLDGSVEKRIKIVVQGNTEIQITPENEIYTIGVNEVIDINCTYSPNNVTEQDFTWTAVDSDVLSVYWNKVRGLKAGTSEIIIKSLDGTVEKRITVVVQEDTGIKITPKQEKYTIGVGEVINVNCTYSPNNVTEQDFTWTASDSSVLSVYWNKVRGLKAGTSEIIIKSLDGTVEKRITVVVQEDTGIKITPKQEKYTIGVGEVINVNCTYSPNNVTEQDFTWTASDSSVLSVYWNKVRGLKAGTSEIIIKSLDGTVEKRITVVVQKDTGIKITPEQEKNTIGVGEVIDIDCTYSPNNVPEQEST